MNIFKCVFPYEKNRNSPLGTQLVQWSKFKTQEPKIIYFITNSAKKFSGCAWVRTKGRSHSNVGQWISQAMISVPFSSVQSLSRVQIFATPRITAHKDSLSITNCRTLLKPMSIESVMPSSHLILCRSLLLLPPIAPSIRVFSNESTLCMRWPK